MTTDFTVGQRVLYYWRARGGSAYLKPDKKLEATVLKVGKERVTISLDEGGQKTVAAHNLVPLPLPEKN